SRCATWLKPHAHGAESQHRSRRRRFSFRRGVEKALAVVVRIYERVLRLALRHPKPILSVVGVLFLGSLVLLLFLGQELFPQVDAGQIVISMRAPTGTRVEATESVVAQVEKAIREEIDGKDLAMIISELGVVPDWSAAYTPNSGPQDALIKVQLTDE